MLATGAEERPLVFGGNDRPGVMQASAVRAYVNRYAVTPGARAVVFTNNSSGYRTARDVLAAGIDVAAVIDARDGGSAASQVAGVPLIRDGVVTAVVARERIAGIHVLKSGQSNADRIEADFVAMSGGWSPVDPSRLPQGREAGVGRRARLLPAAVIDAGPYGGRRRRRCLRPVAMPEGWQRGRRPRRRAGRRNGEADRSSRRRVTTTSPTRSARFGTSSSRLPRPLSIFRTTSR